MAKPLIDVRDLFKTFDGTNYVLDDVNLRVHAGTVYGLIGENGAGKTTLIRHLMGRTTPASGTVRLFGMDPVREPESVLSRIGYLAEARDMPQWMRVGELIGYMSAFYANWDAEFAASMQDAFQLATSTHVSDLSRGQAARLGLLLAVAHRPPLLVLDEPSSGLDPVVRGDILNEIIRSVADDGRTVLFSSHLLDEVQRIADNVGIMNRGKLVMDGPIDSVVSDHRLFEVRLKDSDEALSATLDSFAMVYHVGPDRYEVLCTASDAKSMSGLLTRKFDAVVSEPRSVSLDEIFSSIVAHGRQQDRFAFVDDELWHDDSEPIE